MKIGTYVISKYRSPWKGIIIDIEDCKSSAHGYSNSYKYTIALVLILKDKNGNFPKKRIYKILNVGWLTEIEPFEINPDLLKNTPSFDVRPYLQHTTRPNKYDSV